MEITDSERERAKANLEVCQESMQQKLEQFADEQARKAIEELKKLDEELKMQQQKLAKLPEDLINQLNEAIEKVLNIIVGYQNPKSEQLNVDALMRTIENMLNPLISTLNSLPVPSIPGLSQLNYLLSVLKTLMSQSSKMSEAELKMKIPNKPAIPNELMAFLYDLLATLQSICAALPMILINLIFQMINQIVSLFDQIASVIGVPSIPYPLSIVPQCVKAVPKITEAVLKLPMNMNVMIQGIIRKKLREIAAMKFPDVNEKIQELEAPKDLPACPMRDNSSEES